MKIFLDTADTGIIAQYFSTGLVDGVTTNPTLIMKSGRDPEEVYQEIKDIGVQDISMEVVGSADEMIEEGVRLFEKFGFCSTIKVPMTRDGLMACSKLTDKGIRVNVTLIFAAAHLHSRSSSLRGTLPNFAVVCSHLPFWILSNNFFCHCSSSLASPASFF